MCEAVRCSDCDYYGVKTKSNPTSKASHKIMIWKKNLQYFYIFSLFLLVSLKASCMQKKIKSTSYVFWKRSKGVVGNGFD